MPPSRRGTGFVGLGQYLGLNQGAAQQMGGRLAEDVEKRGQAWNASLQSGMDAFTGAVDKATLQGGQKPTSAAQATQLGATQYAGPQRLGDVADTGGLMAQAGELGARANALGTMGGRSALLQELYGKGGTWGGNMLDSALAGAGGGARLQAARGAFGRLQDVLGNAEGVASAYGQQAAKTTAERAKEYAAMAPRIEQRQTQTRVTPVAERQARPSKRPGDTYRDTKAGGSSGRRYP